MARRRRPADLTDHTWEHVATRELSRALVWAWVWPALAGVLIAGAALHRIWPGGAGAAAVVLAAALLAAVDLYLTHERKGLARYFAAVTIALAGAWMAWVQAAGLAWHPMNAPARAWLVGGFAFALAWARWLHVREGGDEAGLARPFSKAALKAGFEGLRLVKIRKTDTGAVEAEIDHPGVTHDEVVKGRDSIESSWPRRGVPPGYLTMTRNPDAAHRTRVVFADPRLLNRSLPWPGASLPGGSMAEPIRVGIWQDGTPVTFVPVGYHDQVMAMTGAGKSLGRMYSVLGECFTRRDGFVVAVDLMKRRQFLGPMEPALHYLADTPAKFTALLDAINASLPERTSYLGDKHLENWRQGCGLMHGTLYIEEAADAYLQIDADMDETLFPLLRAARSGGWKIEWSIHRASHEQQPTFLRSMAAFTTMGVRNASDAKFGLSEIQAQADCEPEMWADNTEDRGKFYMDAPSLAKRYKTMAGRFYNWGPGTGRMAEHAARFPASARPLDEITAPYFAGLTGPGREPVAASVARPSVTLTTAHEGDTEMTMNDDRDPLLAGWPGSDDPIDPGEIEGADLPIGAGPRGGGGPEVPVSREVALAEMRKQIAEWRRTGVPHGKRPADRRFAIPDLRGLTDRVGRSRTWLYAVMPVLEAEREVRREGDGWLILDKAA